MDDCQQVRVLVVEDEYLVAEEIIRTLNSFGHEVLGQASDGVEALELAESLRPDLVLMDIAMPRMDGLDTARALRDRCLAPIVMLTAHESDCLVARARDAGVSSYLTKPWQPGDLQRAIVLAMARQKDYARLLQRYDELTRRYKRLEGAADASGPEILPICASCNSVRVDVGRWENAAAYIQRRTGARLSHGICPDCTRLLYPDFPLDDDSGASAGTA